MISWDLVGYTEDYMGFRWDFMGVNCMFLQWCSMIQWVTR